MITGILLRNYKSYKNLNFVPITDQLDKGLSVFIGENGVGKSAVLEALDTYFNDRVWNITKNSTKSEAFIAPIFLISKTELGERYNTSSEEIALIEKMSKYFWETTYMDGHPAIKKFYSERETLEYNGYSNDQYYLLILGINFAGKEVYFSSYDYELRKLLKEDYEEQKLEKIFINILQMFREYYAYIYIPVEDAVRDVLKMETRQMQDIMNKDILAEITNVLRKELPIGGEREQSLVTFINDSLDKFIEGVNTQIHQIDPSYRYTAEQFKKQNVTALDIREKILEVYFTKRTLRKNGKEIQQLSSGEQRKAMIDIATAFLSDKGEHERKIVLAIDEPESSLHISHCFDQFKRLEQLANDFGKQILVTTHWYGFLPVTQKGNLHHINKVNDETSAITSFDFYNYLATRRKFPNDIQLKSYYDLTMSLVSFMRRSEETKIIICEGVEDKIYLEHMVNKDGSTMILPVGGCSQVINLYHLLRIPLVEMDEDKRNSGTILCLMDTDKQLPKTEWSYASGDNDKKNLLIRRIQQNREGGIELVNPFRVGKDYENTEIEDCLVPSLYYESINCIIAESADSDVRTAFEGFVLNPHAKISAIKGLAPLLLPKTHEDYIGMEKIHKFLGLDDTKHLVAKKYVELANAREDLVYDLKEEINKLFEPKVKEGK